MILVTGFESYAGRSDNPAAHLASLLDGSEISGLKIVGKRLPVNLSEIAKQVPALLEEFNPTMILSIGLWPGESMIRLEKLAANNSSFEIADNSGLHAKGPVVTDGPDAYLTSLPIEKMQQAIREKGIPCRISLSAGAYLCNALFYTFAHECKRRGCGAVGFMHVPYLPLQVVELLGDLETEAKLEQHQRSDYASMSLSDMERAARVALKKAVEVI